MSKMKIKKNPIVTFNTYLCIMSIPSMNISQNQVNNKIEIYIFMMTIVYLELI